MQQTLRKSLSLLLLLLLPVIFFASGCGESSGGGSGDVVLDVNPPGALLDGTFGGGTGRVLLAAGESSAEKVIEDGSGNLIVAGTVTVAGDVQIAVWRLLPSGDFDTSFGVGGVNSFDPSPGTPDQDTLASVRIDGAGRILVTGTADGTTGDRDIYVARLLTNGALDLTFGTTGGIVYGGNDTGPIHDDTAADIGVDTAGRIVVLGSSKLSGSGEIGEVAVWRFLTIGLLDPAYATNGLFLSGNTTDRGSAMLVSGTGEASLVGSRGPDLTLWLLDADGVLVSSFGAGGVATISDPGANLIPNSISLYDAISVVISGRRTVAGSPDRMFSTRVFGDGVLDNSFGNNGILTFQSFIGNSAGNSIAASISGQMVIAGETGYDNPTAGAVTVSGAMWLLAPNGFLDPSLAGTGIVHLTSDSDMATDAHSIVIDNQSRLVIAGSVQLGAGTSNALVWRVQ